jgi:tetratricopeptide (TPR) repeat protein
MSPLNSSDALSLRAAEGWFELGLYNEADAELQCITPEARLHPEVLQLRWEMHTAQKRWDAAVEVARELLRIAPECETNWLHHAYALRRAADGGLGKAFEALQPAVEKFPDEPIIPFNLACYTCQMGQLAEAQKWLRRALDVGGKKQIKLMALADEDMKPLWKEIAEL